MDAIVTWINSCFLYIYYTFGEMLIMNKDDGITGLFWILILGIWISILLLIGCSDVENHHTRINIEEDQPSFHMMPGIPIGIKVGPFTYF